MANIDVDFLYEDFCAGLRTDLRKTARSLAFELRLAPSPNVPWSCVFKHPVTLEAPRLFSEGIANADPATTRRGVLAHMLAVIEAFGTDRIADEQVEDTPDLRQILDCARVARNEALFEIGGPAAVQMAEEADLRTRNSIMTERDLLGRGDAVDFETYETVSAGKQSVGFTASIVLARTAGLVPPKLDAISSILVGISLGLQFKDDVFDWEDDVSHGGAWAVLLARRSQAVAREGSDLELLRRFVDSSGVLTRMLALSAGRFHGALVSTEALGALELAEWLRLQSAETLDLCERERASPGYVRRMNQLAPWAAEVVA